MNIQRKTPFFSDVIDIIAESLGRPPIPTTTKAANAATWGPAAGTVPKAAPAPATPAESGRLERAAAWLWQRQLRGVDAYIARADGMFAALDRWLWKQRMRETEAWLAKSHDLFELEARIRQLERGPDSRSC
jgi:glycine/D-amino acid oxidase-like deaminating enzyme